MRSKRGRVDFGMSEPEFLLSLMDRNRTSCTVVCLVGGGQEINTGEGGIEGWIDALEQGFENWKIYISPQIALPDYVSEPRADRFLSLSRVCSENDLHLSVSMRSFRSENVSLFIAAVVDGDLEKARSVYAQITSSYPIFITRNLGAARHWLRSKARGSERYGLIASSGAQRLRPFGVHMKAGIDPAMWFLNDTSDVRSSCYLEEVASEFDVQGLEVDWAGILWDGDYHHNGHEWVMQNFKGRKWQDVKNDSRRLYLKNAYRVILTRARQGMVLFVPKGSDDDKTRPAEFYDGTFEFLRACGLPVLP